MCVSDINASAVHTRAADPLALHQTTGDAQWSLVSCLLTGAQLQVTNTAWFGNDVILQELVLNRFLQTGYWFCRRNGFNMLVSKSFPLKLMTVAQTIHIVD